MRQPVRSWCSRRAGVTGLVLVAWSSGACTHWKVQSATPEQVVAQRRPHKLRVTRGDGSRVVLHRPEVLGDTLYGTPGDGRPSAGRPRPAVALGDVREIAIRRINAVGSAALGLGTVALAGVVVLGLAWSSRAD